MNNADRILNLLAQRPGLKAQEIAQQFGMERREVNSLLYGTLRARVVSDQNYRWSLRVPAQALQASRPETPERFETPLARLCRYYLECLSQESDVGVHVFASGRTLDYAPLEESPFSGEGSELFVSQGARSLWNRVRWARGGLALYLGYPVRLRYHQKAGGWEGFFLEPLLLFSLHPNPDRPNDPPSLGDDLPFPNMDALKWLTGARGPDLTYEAIRLAEDLGLAGAGATEDTDRGPNYPACS